jgi:cell wall-associated NlpC family hydrolase
MGNIITLKKAAVALAEEMGHPGKPPYGVSYTEVKGDQINELLSWISAHKADPVPVKDPAYWMTWFMTENQAKHNLNYGKIRPINYNLPPGTTDCSGLTICAFKRAGWGDPSGNKYDGSGFTESLRSHGTKVGIATIQRNDLVHYNNPEHVALYVGNGMVISHGGQGDPVKVKMSYRPIFEVTRNR